MKRQQLQRSTVGRLTVGSFVSAMLQLCARDVHAAQLPVPCTGVACGTRAAPTNFVTSGAAAAIRNGNTLTVQQSSNTATLNWSSFNISADGKVAFNQPNSSSVALNRIYDSSPSKIFGSLSANGQLYLINANGILFGAGSKVNVSGLIASSLNISDSTFASGILSAFNNTGTGNKAALQQFTDCDFNPANCTNTPIFNNGVVTVQTGAQLTATDQGRLTLAAPTVVNSGSLTAPDGQIIMAAGQSVYLQASQDPNLRGLIVQVDQNGKAWNQLAGQLSAPRGNITLVGLAVNQDGRISATTTVSANGSITLEAANGHTISSPVSATQGGQLEIGSSSVMEILPEYADTKTAVDAQTQLQSTISLTGERVLIHGGTIDAPSGKLNVIAAVNPSANPPTANNPQAQIRVDSGTTINLAGSDAEAPMSANLVTVQLRGNELADDPTQRNGALRGQTVTVDVREANGTGTNIANVSSAIAAVGKNVAQRTTAGGTATFQSEGDVVVAKGASIDVSGGKTTYTGGNVQTTMLVGTNGKLYDIATADPLLTYTGVINPTFTQTYDQWGVKEVVATPGFSHYEAGYVQGANAGTVQFAAPSMSLTGTLAASTVNGPYQRTAATEALGGTLIIGLPNGLLSRTSAVPPDFLSPSVSFTRTASPVVISDDIPLPTQTLQLPASYLTDDGFTNTQIYSNTRVTLPAGLPLDLVPGSSLLIQAPRIDINSSVMSLAGSLTFQNVSTISSSDAALPRLGIGVGPGVALDVSGQWTNDSMRMGGPGAAPTLQDAGSLTLQLNTSGSELVLGNQSSLKADGGAWLAVNSKVTSGKGGNITLDANPAQAAFDIGQAVAIEGFGVGTATGGTFALTAPRISISQGSSSAWTTAQRVDDLDSAGGALALYAPLFSNYGFSSINLAATGAATAEGNGDVLTVTSGTTIKAQAQSWQLQQGLLNEATGGTVGGFTQAVVLPDHSGPVTNVSLSVLREGPYNVAVPVQGAQGMQLGDRDLNLGTTDFGNLDIQAGSSILADPGAALSLTGVGSIQVAGTLRAWGGKISVKTTDFEGDVAIFDPGFRPDQGINIASTAILDVRGTTLNTPNVQNLPLGTVLPGGAITLNAQRGTVIAEAGSVINISGTQAALYIPQANTADGYAHEVVASPGGSLTVESMESISLLGDLHAEAGIGNGGTAAAGSLEIDLIRIDKQVLDGGALPDRPPFNADPLQIQLVASTANRSPSASDSNLAVLGIQELERSGIDSLTLVAGGRDTSTPGIIAINSNQPLRLARQTTFDSPTYSVGSGINASISAPYVQLGNTGLAGAATLPLDTGILNVSAQQMNLLGTFAFQGIAAATLTSSGDVQLEGVPTADVSQATGGKLTTAGNLTINAARIYPDTATSFTIESDATDGIVNIGQTTAASGAPLSAAGALTIKAPKINIAGTLLAPFGSIDLEAQDSLTLANGSLVSVSGAGLDVLFGQTQFNAEQWIYAVASAGQSATLPVKELPAKQVTLNAPNIQQQSGATIDLQGGGDLHAYEFVPGTGGSQDRLAAGNVPGLYAILPAQQGQMAPFDPEESASFGHNQTVYLSGIAGLPAGFYSLLPPRYALLPGASLVKVEPSYTSAVGGQIGTLADGTPVVGGYLTSGTTGLHTGVTQYEGFAIYPGSYGQQLASYNISNASSYFTAAAAAADTKGAIAVPADAGTLNLNVLAALNNSLDLEGKVLTKAATGGRGALVNISAPELQISSGGAGSGGITVSGSILQSWNASVLTLGGSTAPVVRTAADGSTVAGIGIQVEASHVTVDSGVQLSADEILLVAQQGIDVKSGASLFSTSGKNGTTLSKLPEAAEVKLTDGAGNDLPQAAALLAVSDLAAPIVTRSSSTSTGTAATINLESGSTVSSGGALTLDTPGKITTAGTVNGKGASWSLSSSSIAFTGTSGSSTDSLNIDSNLLASMQQAGAVRIASAGDIDIQAPVTLGATSSGGAPTLSALTLIGASINNKAGGDSVLGAGTLTLQGLPPSTTSPANDPVPSPGTGTLSLVANTFNVGPGSVTVNGFGTTQAQVGGAVVGNGTGALNVGGALTINAVEITAASDSATKINSTGVLTIGAPTQLSAGNTLPALVGGDLTLSGASIEDSGAIVVPSGLVQLTATSGDIHLGGTASIDASGRMLHAVDQSTASPGGMVSLLAPGNITLDSGSILNVSGAGSAPAGSLNITDVNGLVDLSGTLVGKASGATGGSFMLNAGALRNGFTALASNLTSGGFNNAVDVHVRSGDLNLARNGTLTANSITLTADNGVVDIAGVLSAPSAAKRGFIGLFGGTGVTLENTGQLHADGSGISGRGGEIEISSTCPTCAVTLASGSRISASGPAQMGELVIRAPALAATNDIAINVGSNGLRADVSRAGQVILEAVTVDSSLNQATINDGLAQDVSNAAAFLSTAAPSILARLAPNRETTGTTTTDSGTAVSVRAGVEIQDSNANDSLTLASLDLSQYSQQGVGAPVIDVSVRAAGSLTIDGIISDGTQPGSSPPLVGQYASGALSLVAGANVNSANPLATLMGSSADLTLAQSAIVRTGTGDLSLAAAHDIKFMDGSSAYTTGIAAAPADQIGAGRNSRVMNFADNGGNILLHAGNDVVGSPVSGNSGNYAVTAWQVREGSSKNAAEYGVDLSTFDWNVGALGGGDVTVSAAQNVTNLSAAVSDSLTSASTDPRQVSTRYGAGGGLTMTAGRDIGSTQAFVADGVGMLTAGGGLTSARSYTPSGGDNPAPVPIGSSFALGNSQISVWARQDVLVNAVYNPTILLQPGGGTGGSALLVGQYFTYGSESALNLSSTAGNVSLDMTKDTIAKLVGQNNISGQLSNNQYNLLYLPPNLTLRALQGDLDVHGTGVGTLFPSATGELVLYAGRDIKSNGVKTLQMADNFAATVPTVLSPGIAFTTVSPQPFAGNIHLGDSNPVLISAGRDINDLFVTVPKASQIVAGRDIINLQYQGQNSSASDITLVSAGRDVIAPGASLGFQIQVGGPGSLDVLAGRDVNLGFSKGITTIGNLKNPNLPSAEGADVNVMVGLGTTGADYSDFLQKIIAPSSSYQKQLVAYVESQTGQTDLTFAQAQTSFEGFSEAQRSPLIEQAFFNELTLSGREANAGTGTGFKRGYAAIDALFPNSRTATATGPSPYAGNLNLIYSQIYTQSGGDISLMVPGGQIDVGLAVPPTLVTTKEPSELGIVAEGPGNVSIYAKGDVNVNSSRIFTLGGGNILIWSNEGDIDAGKGSKSSLSVPPPVVSVDSTGQIRFNYSGAVAGSGIRTIQTQPTTPAGDVDLDAPVGTVDAGDAGIGAAGNINLAAQHVIGATNINFGGTATGVPPEVSNLGASLSSASAAAASSTTSATSTFEESRLAKQDTAPLAQTALGWLDVFVTGLGEENCKTEDVECLKRQKTVQ